MGNFLSNGRLSLGVVAALLALGSTGSSRAVADEGWGDLGYTRSEAEVEAIPELMDSEAAAPSPEALAANPDAQSVYSLTTTPSSAEPNADVVVDSDEPAVTDSVTSEDLPTEAFEAPVIDNEAAAIKKSSRKSDTSRNSGSPTRTFGNISTVKNSHGVLTEENPRVQFYVAPFGGATSIIGNTTVYHSPRYAMGAQAGLLLSSNFLLGVSFTYSEQLLSSPRMNSTTGSGAINDVFALKSNHIELGGKLYFLGRESRVRPFFGGGFGWGKNYLNYTTANLQALGYQPAFVQDYTINQVDSFGELGAEVAITRGFVATASFKLRGVLASSTSGLDAPAGGAPVDAAKSEVGSSLSRSASYTVGAGLGIYF